MTTTPAASRVIASGPQRPGMAWSPDTANISGMVFVRRVFTGSPCGLRRTRRRRAAPRPKPLRDALQFIRELHRLAADVVGQRGIDDALDLPRLNALLRGGFEVDDL